MSAASWAVACPSTFGADLVSLTLLATAFRIRARFHVALLVFIRTDQIFKGMSNHRISLCKVKDEGSKNFLAANGTASSASNVLHMYNRAESIPVNIGLRMCVAWCHKRIPKEDGKADRV